MKTRISFLAVALALIAALNATPAHTDDPPPTPTFNVSADVKLFRTGSKAPLKDASNVVIWLTPEGVLQPARLETPPGKYRMVQRDKMFEPSLLVVPIGSLVDFPNLDPWFHNVFSLYRGKRFDLGLYEAGAQKTIRFDRPGASYIFCNIHPEMAAVVLTVDSSFYGISNKAGRVSLPRLPAGKYVMHVWYENAEPQFLDSFSRAVEIGPGSEVLPAVSIPVTAQTSAQHKNKYGRDYDPKSGSTVY